MTAHTASSVQTVRHGTLFLVVGPSGAGKDSLIRAARQSLSANPLFLFPRRVVTRPEDPASEDFESVTTADFERRCAAGEFCLDWGAHGLFYGVPASAKAEMEAGRSVVVNVSRTVIAEARRRFPAVRVIQVTAPHAILEHRLAVRGRASDGDIGLRLARQIHVPDNADFDTATVVNDGSLTVAATAFLDILLAGDRSIV